MTRILFDDLMTEVVGVLGTRYGIQASIRRFRTREETEINSTTEYFVEPGVTSFVRKNVGACMTNYGVRVVAEKTVEYSEADEELQELSEFFEELARDFMASPILSGSGAFLLTARVFSDAPSMASSVALESGYATVFGGIELTYQI